MTDVPQSNSGNPDQEEAVADATPAVNRRRFITGLAGGLAALLAACGRNRTPTPAPLPTPTGTPIAQSSLLTTPVGSRRSFLPLVQNGPPEVALLPTTTPLPTETPTPAEPTATPRPTNTPTPPATPFPPGPPSKLGFVVARNHPQIFEVLASGGVAVISTLEHDPGFVAEIKRISPGTLLIGRIDLPQLELGSLDPLAKAREFVDKLLPLAEDPGRRPYYDAWQSYNEPVASTPDEMKRLAELEAERTRLLAERGIRSCIGNFGTGQPPLEMWEHFFPALQSAKENDGWLGLHEYSAPTIYFMSTRENQGRYPGISPSDTGWLTLRYRQAYNEILKPAGLAIPLVFTEVGVDGLVQNSRPGPQEAGGWQHFQSYWAEHGYGLWGPGAYVEQLVWYDEAMRQDNYVLGGCIFALAASAGWESYDVLGPCAAVLQQYMSVHTRV